MASEQAVDKIGAADFLGLSVATITRRINLNKFPEPDSHGSANTEDTDWWTLNTLEKYQRALARKPRKRNSKNT